MAAVASVSCCRRCTVRNKYIIAPTDPICRSNTSKAMQADAMEALSWSSQLVTVIVVSVVSEAVKLSKSVCNISSSLSLNWTVVRSSLSCSDLGR